LNRNHEDHENSYSYSNTAVWSHNSNTTLQVGSSTISRIFGC